MINFYSILQFLLINFDLFFEEAAFSMNFKTFFSLPGHTLSLRACFFLAGFVFFAFGLLLLGQDILLGPADDDVVDDYADGGVTTCCFLFFLNFAVILSDKLSEKCQTNFYNFRETRLSFVYSS